MMLRKVVSLLPAALLLLMACGDDDDAPKKRGTEKTAADIPSALPPPENPITTSEIDPVDCAKVTPERVIHLSTIQNYSSVITISSGAVVQWLNDVTGTHTVTSESPGGFSVGGEFDLGSVAPGQKVCARFDKAGQFDYFCRHHAIQMHDDRVNVMTAAP